MTLSLNESVNSYFIASNTRVNEELKEPDRLSDKINSQAEKYIRSCGNVQGLPACELSILGMDDEGISMGGPPPPSSPRNASSMMIIPSGGADVGGPPGAAPLFLKAKTMGMLMDAVERGRTDEIRSDIIRAKSRAGEAMLHAIRDAFLSSLNMLQAMLPTPDEVDEKNKEINFSESLFSHFEDVEAAERLQPLARGRIESKVQAFKNAIQLVPSYKLPEIHKNLASFDELVAVITEERDDQLPLIMAQVQNTGEYLAKQTLVREVPFLIEKYNAIIMEVANIPLLTKLKLEKIKLGPYPTLLIEKFEALRSALRSKNTVQDILSELKEFWDSAIAVREIHDQGKPRLSLLQLLSGLGGGGEDDS